MRHARPVESGEGLWLASGGAEACRKSLAHNGQSQSLAAHGVGQWAWSRHVLDGSACHHTDAICEWQLSMTLQLKHKADLPLVMVLAEPTDWSSF